MVEERCAVSESVQHSTTVEGRDTDKAADFVRRRTLRMPRVQSVRHGGLSVHGPRASRHRPVPVVESTGGDWTGGGTAAHDPLPAGQVLPRADVHVGAGREGKRRRASDAGDDRPSKTDRRRRSVHVCPLEL